MLAVYDVVWLSVPHAAYREAKQKWDLATVCLDHMRLSVRGLMPPSTSNSVHYPGMAVMLQLLGALLAVMQTNLAMC